MFFSMQQKLKSRKQIYYKWYNKYATNMIGLSPATKYICTKQKRQKKSLYLYVYDWAS